MNARFSESKSISILNLYDEILTKFQNKPQIISKLEKCIEKAYETIMTSIFAKKSE